MKFSLRHYVFAGLAFVVLAVLVGFMSREAPSVAEVANVSPAAGDAAAPSEVAATPPQMPARPANVWQKRCAQAETEASPDSDVSPEVASDAANKENAQGCVVFQQLIVKETGQRLVEFIIAPPALDAEDAAYQGTLILPLGLALQAGGALKIDENEAYRFAFRTCTAEGCMANVRIDETLIGELRSGEKVALILKNANGQQLSINLSLKGLDTALDTLDQKG